MSDILSHPVPPSAYRLEVALRDHLGLGVWMLHGYPTPPAGGYTYSATQRRGPSCQLSVDVVIAMTPSPPECRVKAIITSPGPYAERVETIHRLPVIPWTDDLAGDVARHLAEHKLPALIAALEVKP